MHQRRSTLHLTRTPLQKIALKRRARVLSNQENELQRDVVRCFVFGARGCGKTSLLEALRGGGKGNSRSSGDAPRSAARFIQQARSRSSREGEAKRDVGGRQRCMVLTECPANSAAELEVLDGGMVDCDLAILMFDVNDPGSVEHLATIQPSIPGTVPCVYLANKCDMLTNVEVPPPAYLSARDLCARHNLADPERMSLPPRASKSATSAANRMFQLLLQTALRPDAARPLSDTERSAQRQKRMLRSVARISTVLVVVGGLSYCAWRFAPSLVRQAREALSGRDNVEQR